MDVVRRFGHFRCESGFEIKTKENIIQRRGHLTKKIELHIL